MWQRVYVKEYYEITLCIINFCLFRGFVDNRRRHRIKPILSFKRIKDSSLCVFFFSCLDINECDKNPCSQECANIYGSYQCYCRQGYYLKEDGHSCEGTFYQYRGGGKLKICRYRQHQERWTACLQFVLLNKYNKYP